MQLSIGTKLELTQEKEKVSFAFSVDDTILRSYAPFCDDFGPLNLASIHDFCRVGDQEIQSSNGQTVTRRGPQLGWKLPGRGACVLEPECVAGTPDGPTVAVQTRPCGILMIGSGRLRAWSVIPFQSSMHDRDSPAAEAP